MHVAIIGAGVAGLSTAWYLNEQGIEVTVFDKQSIGSGASWGNAGQIVPNLVVPLADPTNLRVAITSLYRRSSPITAPKELDRNLLSFLMQFARNSTSSRFLSSTGDLVSLSSRALEEYKHLDSQNISTTLKYVPFTAAFSTAKSARHLLDELAIVAQSGSRISLDLLDGSELRMLEPLVSNALNFGIQLDNQALIDPPQFLENLSKDLIKKGVTIVIDTSISKVERVSGKLQVFSNTRKPEIFDTVVIATGAWLNNLTKEHGVKVPVVAGIGYSMSVEVPENTRGMLFFPETFIATTSYKERLRISSFMKISNVDKTGEHKTEMRLLRNAKRILPNLHWDSVGEFWSGGRPLTPDGKPLIGKTRTPGVYVNAGHGMWGITLGPISGKILANQITGNNDQELIRRFNPLR
jgi:D-amino-acid dehydrogenase